MARAAMPEADRDDALAAFAACHCPDALLIVDSTGALVYASAASEALTGFHPLEAVGTSIFDKVHPDDLVYAAGALQETVRKDGLHIPVHLRVAHASGEWRDMEVTANTPELDSGERVIVLALRPLDQRLVLPERRRNLEMLVERVSGECARATWQTTDEVVAQAVARLGEFLHASRAVFQLAGDDDRLRVHARWDAPETADAGPITLPVDPAPGAEAWPEFTFAPTPPDAPVAAHRELDRIGAVSLLTVPIAPGGSLRAAFHVVWDVLADQFWDDALGGEMAALGLILTATAERGLGEASVHFRSLHDPLTGLANRTEVLDGLRGALGGLGRTSARGGVGVLFCDLDGFKRINDRYGHALGDRVLIDVAKLLRAQTRPGDLVGRIGGDEFVVLCERLHDRSAAHDIADRIRASVAGLAPQDLPDEARLGISIGVAYAEAPRDAEELLSEADHRMYDEKRHRHANAR